MSVELTWRLALLGAVIAADIVAFIDLVAKELRDRSATPAGDLVEGSLVPVRLDDRMADRQAHP